MNVAQWTLPGRTRARRIAAGLVLALGGWIAVAFALAAGLAAQEGGECHQAVVVFSVAAVHGERLALAAEIYHGAGAQAVILTDDGEVTYWSPERDRNLRQFEFARDRLTRAGVPLSQVVLVTPNDTGTYAETVAVRDYAVSRDFTCLHFVTSQYHSRRALWTLGRVFRNETVAISLTYVPAGQAEAPGPLTWWLRTQGWRMVPLEYAKLIYYFIRFG
jgi:uncharacterized SAM-binding protein YcdF (DUF218 family)